MAYAAITSLMRTIHQSMELIGCDLQPFYEKLESLRAILEKSYSITGDLEALTSLETEIAEVAYTIEDMVDSKSRNVLLAQNLEERSRALWELYFLLEQTLECIDSTLEQWMETLDSMKDLKAQTYSLASLPDHVVESPENIMVGHENEFQMMLDQLTREGRELEVVSIVGMGGIGKTFLATKFTFAIFIFENEDSYSLDFEKIETKITLKCGGLPLAITMNAGLLSKICKTLDEWQSIAENVNLVDSWDSCFDLSRSLLLMILARLNCTHSLVHFQQYDSMLG